VRVRVRNCVHTRRRTIRPIDGVLLADWSLPTGLSSLILWRGNPLSQNQPWRAEIGQSAMEWRVTQRSLPWRIETGNRV